MRKRFGAAALAAVLVVSTIIGGCGSSGGSKEEVKKDGGKEQMVFMATGTSNEQAAIDAVEATIKEFNESNEFNVEIVPEWYETEQYKTKLATLMTQDQAPDVFFTYEASYIKNFVDAGKILPITEELDADPEWKNKFYDGIFTPLTFDGEIYGMPITQDSCMIYYNKATFEKYNLTPPETWDDFIKIVKTLKDAGELPMSMGSQDAWVMGNLMLQLIGGVGGHEVYDDLIAGKIDWTDPRFAEAGELVKVLNDLGTFQDGYLGISYDEGRDTFTNGTAAMTQQGTWETANISGIMGDNVGVFLMPGYNKEYTDTQISVLGKSYAIGNHCKNKEAAVAFLKALSSETSMKRYVETVGAIPTMPVDADESKLSQAALDIMELLGNVKYTMCAIDRVLGPNVGGEFNNVSVAIAGGADPKEKFDWLADYQKQEAEQ